MATLAAQGALREGFKGMAGGAASVLSRQCRYDRAVFVLAHMRCGSTALSNILCSRPDISGYGEAHIRYTNRRALGRLLVNQALRRAWRPGATHLFDKILHNRHDQQAPEAFFDAKAIFVARPPGAAVTSIRKLYASLGRGEYGTDQAATEYYIQRLTALAEMWPRFDPSRRVGLTSAELLGDPEATLERISTRLTFVPPLENRYADNAAARKGGAGDPLVSGHFTRIESRPMADSKDPLDLLQISDSLKQEAQSAHDALVKILHG